MKDQNIQNRFTLLLHLIGITIGYGLIAIVFAVWGWTCDYLVHGMNDRFQNIKATQIIIGWISMILCQIVFGIFIFLASLPMLNYPWSRREGVDSSCCRKTTIITIALIILSCSYPAMYEIEIHLLKVEDSPSMWSSSGALYALSAYLKILPIYWVLFKYRDMETNRQEDTTHKKKSPLIVPTNNNV